MSSEISDTIDEVTKEKEDMLREELADSLDQGTSHSVIVVWFNEMIGRDEQTRRVVGVPYEISDGNLVIGMYAKDVASPPPRDYEERKMRIPIKMIVTWDKMTRVTDYL